MDAPRRCDHVGDLLKFLRIRTFLPAGVELCTVCILSHTTFLRDAKSVDAVRHILHSLLDVECFFTFARISYTRAVTTFYQVLHNCVDKFVGAGCRYRRYATPVLLRSAIAEVMLVLVDQWVKDTYSWYEEDDPSSSSVSLANERDVCDVMTFSRSVT